MSVPIAGSANVTVDHDQIPAWARHAPPTKSSVVYT
jgi:hypothetical protein